MAEDSAGAPVQQAAVHDIHLQTVDTLPSVCTDVLVEIHRGLARSLRASLSQYLETPLSLSMPEHRQQPYGQYLQAVDTPVFAAMCSADFLSGPLLLVADHELASSLIDRLLGGSGTPTTDRWPTDVDAKLFSRVLGLVLNALDSAFRPLLAAHFVGERTELSPHFLPIAAHHEPVIAFRLGVEMAGNAIGTLTMCYPFASLATLIDSLPGADMPAPPAPESPSASIDVLETAVQLRLALRSTRLAVGDFMSLREGDVVILDHWADEPAIGLVGDQPIVGVDLGQLSGHLAAVVSDWREK